MEAAKRLLLDVLRVPAEPDPPRSADPQSLRVFRAAPSYLRYKLLTWGIRQAGVLLGVLFVLALSYSAGFAAWVESLPIRPLRNVVEIIQSFGGPLELLALAFLLVQLPFGFALVFLDWENRWYMVSDRSLRIREGIWRIVEQTMTFSNIQNVAVRQNPLQRWFGIAEVEVRTAGGGGSQQSSGRQSGRHNLHLAYFRGVDNAGEIRDLILGRLRRLREAGLGDPDDVQEAEESSSLEAARELLAEARALREAVE